MKIENLERQLFIESNSDSMKEVVNINACISRQLWMEFFGIVENIIVFFIKEEKKKRINSNKWRE